MAVDNSKKLCLNRGCNQLFEASKNLDDSCAHHPGVPVIHDDTRKWSCCEKSAKDVTTVLKLQGCTYQCHNCFVPEFPIGIETLFQNEEVLPLIGTYVAEDMNGLKELALQYLKDNDKSTTMEICEMTNRLLNNARYNLYVGNQECAFIQYSAYLDMMTLLGTREDIDTIPVQKYLFESFEKACSIYLCLVCDLDDRYNGAEPCSITGVLDVEITEEQHKKLNEVVLHAKTEDDYISPCLLTTSSSLNVAQMCHDITSGPSVGSGHVLNFLENSRRLIPVSKATCGSTLHPGTTGLKNPKNDCFMNAVLQALSNTTSFSEYFKNDGYMSVIGVTAVVETFAVVIRSLWARQFSSFYATDLKHILSNDIEECRGDDQQDAALFLMCFINKLRQDLGENDPLNVCNIFTGHFDANAQCCLCDDPSTKDELFTVLPLTIVSRNCSLDKCLLTFSERETSDRRCTKCGNDKAQTWLSISSYPQILIIQLRRLVYEKHELKKLTHQVTFQEELQMEGHQYHLYCVIRHKGGPVRGHYIAYCKNYQNGRWFKFDDSIVSEISLADVLKIEAYVLFFSRQDVDASIGSSKEDEESHSEESEKEQSW